MLFVAEQQQVNGKPFLRIISDGPPLGLKFDSESDKVDVLELLKQIQPKGGNGGSGKIGVPDAREQQMLFAANKDLKVVYNQLVPTGVLSESEFWKEHYNKNLPNGLQSTANVGQRLGLSSVLHEVEKLHDGKTERVNIHLTPGDIQRIFQEKPEVNKAFVSFVPHAMTEQEFWQKYFKLEYKKAARRYVGF